MRGTLLCGRHGINAPAPCRRVECRSSIERIAPLDLPAFCDYNVGMDRNLFRDRLLAVGLGAAGMVIAMLAVYVGTGLHDGFGDWELHRLGRRLRRYLPYALLLAAGMGLMLHAYYTALIRATPAGWTMLISIPRAFIHFALFGLVALLAFAMVFACRGLAWLGRLLRLLRDPGGKRWAGWSKRIIRSGISLPLWFILFPMGAFGAAVSVDSRLVEEISEGVREPGLGNLRRRMLALLPWVIACVFIWVGAESEDSGDRVDPYWLTAVASIWFADYLMVAYRVVPALRARRDAAP